LGPNVAAPIRLPRPTGACGQDAIWFLWNVPAFMIAAK